MLTGGATLIRQLSDLEMGQGLASLAVHDNRVCCGLPCAVPRRSPSMPLFAILLQIHTAHPHSSHSNDVDLECYTADILLQ